MELLALQREYSTSDRYIFTGYKHEAMDPKCLRVLMRAMEVPYTIHGFRSSFRTWVDEQTDTDFYVAEGCIAHQIGNAVARAYLRSDQLDKRRAVMARWASFCDLSGPYSVANAL
jgi:integrase